MKVECKTCGKKFKGTHGVAVHATRMHRVDSISGAAEVPQKKNKLSRMSVFAAAEGLRDEVHDLQAQLGQVHSRLDELLAVIGM